MDNQRMVNDEELRESINYLLDDAKILLQMVSHLQDVRYKRLTSIEVSTNDHDFDKLDELAKGFKIIHI